MDGEQELVEAGTNCNLNTGGTYPRVMDVPCGQCSGAVCIRLYMLVQLV